MRKFNLIWIMAFLLFMPMAISEIPDFYVLIEADKLNGTWDTGATTLSKVGDNLWAYWYDDPIDYQEQRAKIFYNLFQISGAISDDLPLRINNETQTHNATRTYSSFSSDYGKRMIFMRIYHQDPPSSSNSLVQQCDISNTATNYNVSMWFQLYGAGNSGGAFQCSNSLNTGFSAAVGYNSAKDYLQTWTGLSPLPMLDNPSYAKHTSTTYRSGGNYNTCWQESYILLNGTTSCSITSGAYYLHEYYYDSFINYSFPEFGEYGILIDALDNYTKYGYNQTTITNFSVEVDNGTDTFTATANTSSFVGFIGLTGLWNLTFSHDDYSNSTYENVNFSNITTYTGYMTQTHEHTLANSTTGPCATDDLYCFANQTNIVGTSTGCGHQSGCGGILTLTPPNSGEMNRGYLQWDFTPLVNASRIIDSGDLQMWRTDCDPNNECAGFKVVSYQNGPLGINELCGDSGAAPCSDEYRETTFIASFEDTDTIYGPADDCRSGGMCQDGKYLNYDGFETETQTVFNPNFYPIVKVTKESGSASHWIKQGASNTLSHRPYVETVSYVSNFSIGVFDSVTGDPITDTDITINISNGAWSREDTISGINYIVYPFDEGIYDISVIVEGVEQITSGYDLSTESNYLQEDFTFYFNMTNCSDDSSDIALNFSIVDEENESLIISDVTTDFDLTTDFYTTTYDFDLTGQNNYTFCLDPADIDVTLNGFINYQPEDTSEYPFARQYWFTDATIRGDTTSDITLYVLNGGVSDTVTFTVTHDGLGLSEGKVWVQRYISGNYILVNMVDITAGSGQTDLRTVDTFYKFLVYDSDNNLLGTFGPMTISTSVSLNTFTSQSFDTSWYNYLQLRDYQYTFSYSNTTNISDLTYSHSSGLSTEDCLRVVYSEFLNDEQVCYTCSSSASATLQCLITDTDATYTLQYVTLLNGTWFIRAAEQLSLKETLADNIGNDGLLFAFLLIGILAFVGLFNPAAAVWFAMGGLIFVTLLGLINLSITALVGLLFVGGLIAVKLRT